MTTALEMVGGRLSNQIYRALQPGAFHAQVRFKDTTAYELVGGRVINQVFAGMQEEKSMSRQSYLCYWSGWTVTLVTEML